MYNKLLLLAYFILFSAGASAQIQKEKGRILKSDGQELSGHITHYFDSPLEIFYWDAENVQQVLASDQVSEIKLLNGEYYITRPYKVAKKTEQIVFQVILSTPKINFYMREGNQKEYYVEKEEKVYKLENNQKLLKSNGKELKSYDYQYISTLTQLMQDRMDLVSKLNTIKLESNELLKLLIEYSNGDFNYYYKPNAADKQYNNYYSVYTQLSNLGGQGDMTINKFSYGVQVGLQYHFGKGTKNSIKLALNNSKYNFSYQNVDLYSLLAKYQFEFIQKNNFVAYLNAQLLELYQANINYDADWQQDYTQVGVAFSFRPGAGVEFRTSEKLSFIAEINDLLYLESLPRNFAIGLNYRLGKVTRK